MRYTSTRNKAIDVSFEEAITLGYAPDGGLFVPRSLPTFTSSLLQQWKDLSYPQLMFRVLRLFIHENEIADAELLFICEQALQGFDDPHHAIPVIPFPLTKEKPHNKSSSSNSRTPEDTTTQFYVAELFHGPTFCFKDLGMRAVILLLHSFLHRSSKYANGLTLLVSTTGDTGPAAAQIVHDLNDPRLRIVVHYPDDQISDFQRKQLTTLQTPHVRVVAFSGGGDDMDAPIQNLLSDAASHPDSLWTGVNSYNIGRPLTQTVMYIWTYLCLARERGWDLSASDTDDTDSTAHLPKIDIIVPTGAMGNIVAGYICHKMGLPIRKLVAAVNINDITHQGIQHGTFHRSEQMQRTLSEAINIQVPYNFERLLYYLSDENDVLVQEWYQDLKATQKITLSESWLEPLHRVFDSARVTDAQLCQAAQNVFARYLPYVVDPHTAVAFSAGEQLRYLYDPFASSDTATERSVPLVLFATASPCKFEHAVTTALGVDVWNTYVQSEAFPKRAQHVLQLPEQPYTRYPSNDTEPIAKVQQDWEARTRELVRNLEQQLAR